jgi:hypothetical protein
MRNLRGRPPPGLARRVGTRRDQIRAAMLAAAGHRVNGLTADQAGLHGHVNHPFERSIPHLGLLRGLRTWKRLTQCASA